MLAIPKEEKLGLDRGRTWSGDGVDLHIAEATYPIVYNSVQSNVDREGDEGEKSRDEGKE